MKNDKIRTFLTGRAGYALEAVLIFLAAFVVLGFTVYSMTQGQMRSSVYQSKKTAAFYAAEAGIQDALQVLAATPTWTQGFTNKPFRAGFYTVKLDTATTPMRITSKGWFNDASGRTVQAAVKVDFSTSGSGQIFGYAVGASPGGITMNNGSVVNGDVFAGPVGMNNNCKVTGKIETTMPPLLNITIPKPAAPCNYKQGMKTLGPCYVDGDLMIWNHQTVTLTGTLYVTGKFTLDNGCSLLGVAIAYIGGDIMINNNSRLGDDTTTNSPFIYAPGEGTIMINNHAATTNVLIYAPGRDITLNNGTAIAGSVIGGTVNLNNHNTVTHADVALPAIGAGVVPDSWVELY